MPRIRKTQADKGKNNASTKDVWNIAVYIRLSRDDGNDESLSITNQRKIIADYLKRSFEGKYNIADYYIDDGLTGTDYDRPDFQRMLHDVESGKVNCVICKNLSRAFRNYSDQGYFLESYFPLNKTRFITISDPKVDSFTRPETIQNMEVPITGLMNDRFACKTSNDIRETFDTKRRNGEFIGAFAPYGYAKDRKDKNMLVVDSEAAQIVRDIFMWYANGMSKAGVVRRLNEIGVPNPTKYKRQKGFNYNNPHVNENDGLWSVSTVARILKNQTYIGNMVQGRQKVISYKVHNKINLPQEEWIIKENTHEPIITPDVFYKVQSLQNIDTRAAPDKKQLYLFSGFLRCADCLKALTRKKSKDKVYYVCRTYTEKSKDNCTKHSVREDILQQIVLKVVQNQISLLKSIDSLTKRIDDISPEHTQADWLNSLLKSKSMELERIVGAADNLYVDWKNSVITKSDYVRMKNKFDKQSRDLQRAIKNLDTELKEAKVNTHTNNPYLQSFIESKNISYIERGLLTELIAGIYIHEDGCIKIELNFSDQYKPGVDK